VPSNRQHDRDRGAASFRTVFLVLLGVLVFVLLQDSDLGYTFNNEIDGVESTMFDQLTDGFEAIFSRSEELP
jgi:hypothetical protein